MGAQLLFQFVEERLCFVLIHQAWSRIFIEKFCAMFEVFGKQIAKIGRPGTHDNSAGSEVHFHICLTYFVQAGNLNPRCISLSVAELLADELYVCPEFERLTKKPIFCFHVFFSQTP